jgi:hypothetical protein
MACPAPRIAEDKCGAGVYVIANDVVEEDADANIIVIAMTTTATMTDPTVVVVVVVDVVSDPAGE